MKPISTIALALVAAIAAVPPTMAHDYKIGDLTIEHPWARVTIPGRPGAAYFGVHNMGTVDDRILSVSSPIADRAGLHTSLMDDGVMRMRPIDSIELPAGKSVALEPGGLHIMLLELKGTIVVGEMVPLAITFERAGTLSVEAPVHAMGNGSAMSREDGAQSHAEHAQDNGE